MRCANAMSYRLIPALMRMIRSSSGVRPGISPVTESVDQIVWGPHKFKLERHRHHERAVESMRTRQAHCGTVIVLRRTTFLAVLFLTVQRLAKGNAIYNGYTKALAARVACSALDLQRTDITAEIVGVRNFVTGRTETVLSDSSSSNTGILLSDVTVDAEVLASHVFVPPTPVPPDPDPLLPECGVSVGSSLRITHLV